MASAKYYTVDDLITSVTRRGSVPVSDNTISNDDMIRFANEEMDENLVALILSTRGEIYLTYQDIAIESGTQNYSIPYRAIGSKVRIIKPIDSDGREGHPLAPVDLERTYDINDSYSNIRGFYLRNDQIIIIPDVGTLGTDTLRVYYYLRPNNLVDSDRAAQIRSIDTATKTVIVDAVPSNITNTTLCDTIQALPNHKIYNWDQTVSINRSNKTITFAEDLPDGLQVGDYVCTAGETITPQIPVDVLPVLEQSVVCKVLEAIGDTEGLKNAYARLQKLEQRLLNVIGNRIEAPGKVAANGFLNKRRRASRW